MSNAKSIQELRGGNDSPLSSAIDKMPFNEDGIIGVDTTPKPAAVKAPDAVNPNPNPDPVTPEFVSPFDKKKEEEVITKPTATDEEFEAETEREIEEMNKAVHPGEAFRKVKTRLKESNTIIQELQNKIKSYEEGKIEASPEYEKIKAKLDSYEELIKQNEELSKKVASVDYRETADYKNKILAPYDDITSLAKTLATKNGVDATDIMRAISERDYSAQSEAIKALKPDLDDRSYASIIKLADEMTILYQREAQMEENASVLLEQSRSASAAMTAKERERNALAYKKAVSTTFETYQDQIPLFIADDGTESPLSKNLRDQAALVDFDEMTTEQKAFAAMSAVSLAPMIRKYNELTKKIAALSARDQMSDSLTPRDNGFAPAKSTSTPVSSVREGETPKQAIDRILNL